MAKYCTKVKKYLGCFFLATETEVGSKKQPPADKATTLKAQAVEIILLNGCIREWLGVCVQTH